MPAVELTAEAIRQHLDKVLGSPAFGRNQRLARFLRLAVERHLEGRDHELKESVIGTEIFGRKPDYDPKSDGIVRTEARRLRALLNEYYLRDGQGDALVIDLPKGGYVPVLRCRANGPEMSSNEAKRRWRGRLVAALAGFVAAAGLLVWWRVDHAGAGRAIPIAVLPLENLSHDPADDYFADGLTDELIRNLSIIDGLSPRSRTSSFAFKGKPRNVHAVGKELATDYIVEGSVLRAGRRLRVDAQLIRVRDDFPVWSGKFDRELSDVFAIQDEIARGIVNGLRLKLGQGRRRYETSVDAYDPYLRARALQAEQGLHGYPASTRLFEDAIAKDPTFAPAYAGVAAAYAGTSAEFENLDRQQKMLAKMRAAGEKAIQLDPLLAEGHAALGMAYARDGNWAQSERSFRRAIELDASRSLTNAHFAMYLLLVLGRADEALRQLRIAVEADPLSPEIHYYLAYVLTSSGRYDEAAANCEKLPEDFPSKSQCLGRSRLGQGRIGEAVQVLGKVNNRGYLGYAYAKAGRRADAQKVAADLAPNPFNEALVFAGLGDRDRMLDALERMAVLGPVRIGRALTFPEFSLVRNDPRIRALRRNVGLPE